MSTPPQDPLTVLMEAATSMHELFESFLRAGFKPGEALYLVGEMARPRQDPTAP